MTSTNKRSQFDLELKIHVQNCSSVWGVSTAFILKLYIQSAQIIMDSFYSFMEKTFRDNFEYIVSLKNRMFLRYGSHKNKEIKQTG